MTATTGPLAGVRVLDLSRVLAGPFCTMVLGDLGADVIKIEQPGRGDDTRAWGPPFAGSESAYYLSVNRNKRSITVDFKPEAGRKIIRDLAARSDVLIENFRPGTLERLGLGYDDLRVSNPRLIYCSISGFGHDGPGYGRPGLDVIVAAAGGLLGITGEEGRPPVKPGVALIDIATALYATSAINAALYARQASGVGQKIELSLLGVQIAALINIASSYLVGGETPRRWGSAHPAIVPYPAFEAADGYVVIGATNDALWQKFCPAVGLDHLAADQRFATNVQRVQHREEIVTAIAAALKALPRAEIDARLRAAGVPCAPVNDLADVFADPQVAHLGMVQDVSHPTLGSVRLTGIPATFSATPPAIRRYPPLLGEHTVEVLRDILGYDDAAIRDLRASGVIGS
ncbi:MAG: CaiB/BaiF CoA transferase family protein [Thermomicrobiales bacterium]